MLAALKKLSAEVSPPFMVALAVMAGFFGYLIWDQSYWWIKLEDYSFGWLVPAFIAFVIYDRWPKILAAASACAAGGSPRVTGWRQGVVSTLVAISLVAGAFMFVLGSLYRANTGSSHPASLTLTLGMVGLVVPALIVSAPRTASPVAGGFLQDARLRLLALFIFPLFVWLVSAPMVTFVEGQVRLFLLDRVVSTVAFVFDLLGLPIEQHGNVLTLPKGSVGVEDACSGIRSLTGCLFAGSFLGAVFLDKLWKKVTLVVAAMGLAILTNICRSLFLTAWAYNYGPEAIEGFVHDAAGYAVLGLTVIGLLCLLPIMNLKIDTDPDDDDGDENAKGPGPGSRPAESTGAS